MTKNEAAKLLRICQKHNLPKPYIRKGQLGGKQYEVHWKTQRMKVVYRRFEAAMEFVSSMLWEKGEGWGL